MQLDLPACDPRHVQEVVDQPGFHFDAAADHFQRLAHCRRKVGSILEHGHAHDDRRQRRAQFVAEDGEEMVLGAVGLFGGGLGVPQGLLGRNPLDRQPDVLRRVS